MGSMDEKVVLLFAQNVVGDRYVYKEPVLARSNFATYVVSAGQRKDAIFNKGECFEVAKLSSKIHKKGPNSIYFSYPERTRTIVSHYGTQRYNPNVIGIVLDEAIEKEVYEKLKAKIKKEPTHSEFIVQLVGFGDCIGRSIEHIMNTGKGFEIHINSDVDQVREPYREVIEQALLSKTQPTASMEAAAKGTKKEPSVSMPSAKSYLTPAVKEERKADSQKVVSRESVETVDADKMKEALRKKIIGQDDAIDKVVNNIYFNQKYIENGDPDLLRYKANILLDGPTGSGKTFILDEVARGLSLPIVVTPATNYSTVGYRGSDLTEILEKLMQQTGGDLELAERGIVAFDEFDKLGNRGLSDDLSMRKALQQELLTFIGGTKINFSYNGRNYEFDTSRLTIIGMGAFQKLREDKIAENEKKYSPPIGFAGVSKDSYERVYSITKEDYIHEGLEREMVGRFTCIAHTNELGVEELKNILLTSTASPLIQLKAIETIMHCKIKIEESIIDEIAQMAYDTNTGARGLIEIVQSLKDVVSNDILSHKGDITITREHLDKAKLNHIRTYHDRPELRR